LKYLKNVFSSLLFRAWRAEDFLSTTVMLSCEKEGDDEKRKITRKGGPGFRRRAWGMPEALPLTHLLIKAGGRCTAESLPLSPLHPYPTWDSSLKGRKIFVMASRWRSRVEKLISDSDGDRFLFLPLFDRTPVSRDIDRWRKLV
jgi:hypothetical protein